MVVSERSSCSQEASSHFWSQVICGHTGLDEQKRDWDPPRICPPHTFLHPSPHTIYSVFSLCPSWQKTLNPIQSARVWLPSYCVSRLERLVGYRKSRLYSHYSRAKPHTRLVTCAGKEETLGCPSSRRFSGQTFSSAKADRSTDPSDLANTRNGSLKEKRQKAQICQKVKFQVPTKIKIKHERARPFQECSCQNFLPLNNYKTRSFHHITLLDLVKLYFTPAFSHTRVLIDTKTSPSQRPATENFSLNSYMLARTQHWKTESFNGKCLATLITGTTASSTNNYSLVSESAMC